MRYRLSQTDSAFVDFAAPNQAFLRVAEAAGIETEALATHLNEEDP